nr:hypothetical protein Ccr10_gp005 [Caulobacter phage Ccr10]ARB13858.1 hypothetical protein Ccr10_gp328 [Caulobacter phage Ccr10]ARB14562.1 hypothetical protein Ccr29_gp005 [Caulobacter phage Ccr29]ARB14897.1 hypothetical protein Ccr29_gp341 [Caulobacter phage Ccr29]
MLYTPAARRLRAYRETAAKNAEIHARPHMAGNVAGYNESVWPTTALGVAAKAGAFKRPETAGNWSEDRKAYHAPAWPAGWRVLGTAEEVCRKEGSRRVEHSGWYTTPDDYSATLSGYVLQIPARDGVAQYVAGVAHSEFDRVTVYPSRRFDNPLDAASAADQIAERDAEEEREYQSAWQAGVRFAELGAEVKEARAEALAILGERRKVKGLETPALCGAIRAQVESLLEKIEEARAKRDALAQGNDPGLMFYPSPRLVAAFNEGAAS